MAESNAVAVKFLLEWWDALYADPNEVCPYESAEGGYQWIWGGPYDAEEEVLATWGGVFTDHILRAVLMQLDKRDIAEWSGSEDGTAEAWLRVHGAP